MQTLKQLLFITIFVVGLSFVAMAQNKGDKKDAPKDQQELNAVEPDKPKDGKSKDDKPKNDTRNKESRPTKPQSFILKKEN